MTIELKTNNKPKTVGYFLVRRPGSKIEVATIFKTSYDRRLWVSTAGSCMPVRRIEKDAFWSDEITFPAQT